MSDLTDKIAAAQREAGERVVMDDLKAKGMDLYDWSVKKLKDSPDDEQIGAGVPLEILVGVMKAWPTYVCPCGKCGYCKAADYLRAHRVEGYC